MTHVVLHRYRVNPDKAEDFVAAWSRLAEINQSHFGTRGARLHLADDGLHYAYSRWPNREAFDEAQKNPAQTAARALMSNAIIERLPLIRMEIKADLLEPEY